MLEISSSNVPDWRQKNTLKFQNGNKRKFDNHMNRTLTVCFEAILFEPCVTMY